MINFYQKRSFFLFFFVTAATFSCKEIKEPAAHGNAFNNIIERAQYDYDLVKNPTTGTIPEGVFEMSYQQGRSLIAKEAFSPLNVNPYLAAGPNNLGGRTRAIAYDVRFNGATNQIILAGSVSSGVMRTVDGGANWARVSGTSNIHNITCIAQDPRVGFQDTWYLGTGESLGNSASASSTSTSFYLGNGLYKSTDNGITWNRLPNSNLGVLETFDTFRDLISKVVVNPVNGNVYFASVGGIFKSANGGNNWTFVLSAPAGASSGDMTDIVCTNAGILYAGLAGTTNFGSTRDGVWRSVTGDSGGWVRIANSDVVTGWKTVGSYRRIVLALAPSNQNILYALYDNATTGGIEADFFRYDDATGIWLDRSANLPDEAGGNLSGNDPFSVQGGYDMVVSVKPDDENYVVIGGTNLYRSSDGFATPVTTSGNRIGGYNSNLNYNPYTNHHADIHALVFEPGSSVKLTTGDDGGLHVTGDFTASPVSWASLNNNYQTFQYYFVAIDPTLGSTKYLGGAQDNGTTHNTTGTGSFTLVFGGDGASTGISSGNAFHYCATQEGNIYRRLPASAPNFLTAIKPTAETNKGLFVTLFHLDPDNTEDLYYANNNRLWRTTNASTVSTGSGWTQIDAVATAIVDGNSITSFATTRGAYSNQSALYMGTNNAKIYRLDDPRNAAISASPIDITPAGITAGSRVLGIAVAPYNDDTVMAVISNYGVPSVFWTGNATTAAPTWVIVEGTGAGKLDLPSFRSCAIIAKQNGNAVDFEYYAGTSVGLFSTVNINGSSQATANNTAWVKEGSGVIDQSVITSIAVRHNDNTLLLGTHGNGLFVSTIGSVLPVTLTSFTAQRQNNYNHLQWTTSFEFNTKEFVVERKYRNENEFRPVISLPAAGHSNFSKTYSINDNGANFDKGDIYYRLKMIDIDGTYKHSQTVLIKSPKTNFITNVYPTVSNGKIFIATGKDISIKVINVSVTNSMGQVVINKQIGFEDFSLNIENLSKGNYYLKIESFNKTKTFVTQISRQ